LAGAAITPTITTMLPVAWAIRILFSSRARWWSIRRPPMITIGIGWNDEWANALNSDLPPELDWMGPDHAGVHTDVAYVPDASGNDPSSGRAIKLSNPAIPTWQPNGFYRQETIVRRDRSLLSRPCEGLDSRSSITMSPPSPSNRWSSRRVATAGKRRTTTDPSVYLRALSVWRLGVRMRVGPRCKAVLIRTSRVSCSSKNFITVI